MPGSSYTIHGNKPLRCRAEDDRCPVSPAMRITMPKLFYFQQQFLFEELLYHHIVCLPYQQTSHQRHLRKKTTVIVYRVIYRQTVLLSHDIVIGAVCRSGVNSTSTCIHRYMGSQNDRDLPLIKRMSQQKMLKRATLLS